MEEIGAHQWAEHALHKGDRRPVGRKPKHADSLFTPNPMTNTFHPQMWPPDRARKQDAFDKYIDPVTHELILPDIEEIKARMVAKITPEMFPSIYDLVTKLTGDAASVRDTIIEAFHKNFFEGIEALTTACSTVADIAMGQRLVAAVGKLGRYDCFELHAQWELEFLARHAPTENVRKAAARWLKTAQRYKYHIACNLSPESMSRLTKRIYALIESATTDTGAKGAESADRPPSEPKSPRSGRGPKARAAAKRNGEPNLDEAVEQDV
jgi:hypothetical protein